MTPISNWHTEIIQGTDEWKAIRLGKVTASIMSDILAEGRGGQPSATRAGAMASLILARYSGVVEESYYSTDMQRGNELETLARTAYEELAQDFVGQVGFIDHPDIPWYGASPDGYLGDYGLEIKCPRPSTHLATLRGAPIKKDYRDQMDCQMDCGDFLGVDFVSYCPEFPGKNKIFVKRFMREEKAIQIIRAKVKEFNAEVEEALDFLRKGE